MPEWDMFNSSAPAQRDESYPSHKHTHSPQSDGEEERVCLQSLMDKKCGKEFGAWNGGITYALYEAKSGHWNGVMSS